LIVDRFINKSWLTGHRSPVTGISVACDPSTVT
jgi:hypothetical protein